MPCSLLNSRISDKKTVYVFERERDSVCVGDSEREHLCKRERERERTWMCVR